MLYCERAAMPSHLDTKCAVLCVQWVFACTVRYDFSQAAGVSAPTVLSGHHHFVSHKRNRRF